MYLELMHTHNAHVMTCVKKKKHMCMTYSNENVLSLVRGARKLSLNKQQHLKIDRQVVISKQLVSTATSVVHEMLY